MKPIGVSRPDWELSSVWAGLLRSPAKPPDPFVTAVQLATGPTTENIVEIVGQAGFVRAHRPRVEYFRHQSLALGARRSPSLMRIAPRR
jgi:hypothetical protein